MPQTTSTQERPAAMSVPPTATDFDQWAKAVRQQMMEALKRRGNNESDGSRN